MIYLASASPRRRELLKMIVPDFEVLTTKDVEEVYPVYLLPADVPAYLSALKASAYIDSVSPHDVLITADTVVILDDKILGKPADRDDAIDMLCKMQGRTHVVVTGVTICYENNLLSFSNRTEVEFDKLTLSEIEYYVDKYEPFDKAGAYGIQEWIGAAAIIGIKGSFYNVMGLPVHSLYLRLKELKVI